MSSWIDVSHSRADLVHKDAEPILCVQKSNTQRSAVQSLDRPNRNGRTGEASFRRELGSGDAVSHCVSLGGVVLRQGSSAQCAQFVHGFAFST